MIQLKITIKDINPPIWRRVIVARETTLLELHDIIQFSFGWTDSHLFIFQIGSLEFVNSPDWEEEAINYQSAERGVLGEIIPKFISEGESFSYIYDLGDYWHHNIIVEKVYLAEKRTFVPFCVSGNRACPPENIGGSLGYQLFLELIKDPESQNLNSEIFSRSIDFNPEEFDIVSVNRELVNYVKHQKLRRASSWETRVNLYNPVDEFSSAWTKRLTKEYKDYAKGLPFRRDLVTMLKYLKENQVKGTKALGNFPRKHIRGITSDFVKPSNLDLRIGERVYKLRSEDEVPELVFMHIFANVSGLILGGENMIWEVSFLGEMFLEKEAHEQVWFLVKYWFTWFNWYYCYRYEDYEEKIELSEFQNIIFKLFLNYPLYTPLDPQKIVQEIDKIEPEWIKFRPGHSINKWKVYFFLDVVIEPFEKFGLIETLKEQLPIFENCYIIKKVKMTNFGRSLIKEFFKL